MVDIQQNSPSAATSGPPAKLRGNLGVIGLVFTVLAYNGPLATMAGFVPLVIGLGNESGAPATYVVVGAVILMLAVGLVAMSRYMKSPGAFYSYIAAGIGRAAGLGGAFVAFIAYFLIGCGGLVFGGLVVHSLVTDTFGGPDIPFWIYSIVMWVCTSGLSLFNINLSARVLSVLLAIELVVVLGWEATVGAKAGIAGIHWASFTPGAFTSGNLVFGLVFAVLTFSGFEACAVFREETKNPLKTVPRATYVAVIVLAVLYALGALMYITALGPTQAVAQGSTDPTGSFISLMQHYFGRVIADMFVVLLTTSVFASIIAIQNVASRYLYVLGSDGVIPSWLGRVHSKTGSPRNASIVVAIGVAVVPAVVLLVGANPVTAYANLTGVGGFCLLILMTFTAVAVVRFFRSADHDANVFKAVIAPVIAFLGLAAILVLAIMHMDAVTGLTGWAAYVALAGILLIAGAGIGLALYYKSRRPKIYEKIGRQDL
jgi:amino acid transporter